MRKKFNNTACYLVAIVFLGLWSSGLTAQDKPKPIRSRMSISVFQGDGQKVRVQGLVRAKIDGRYTGLAGLPVQFITRSDSSEAELGEAETNGRGIAKLEVDLAQIMSNEDSLLTLEAVFAGNERFKKSDDDIEFKEAKLEVVGYEEDSVRYIKATLTSGGMPIEGEDVTLYIRSMTLPMVIGDGETNEEGVVVKEFPESMPGNPDGTMDIRAFIEDTDDYGNMESWVSLAWGISHLERAGTRAGSLVSTRPPLWLFIVFMAILVFIWGHYIMVFRDLFKLKKMSKAGA